MTTKALERQVGRAFSPRAHCGLNATGATSPKIFGRDITVWVFAPEELRGLNRDGFDVAIGARFAVNEDFELSAGWISDLHLPQSSSATAGRLGLPIMGTY